MKITLLGTGTSQGIPVIGCSCAVCTSDDPRDKRLRCAALIETEDETVVIDVGPDFRQQMLRVGTQRLNAALITHDHNDHIIGLDDIRPFNFRQRTDLPVYAEPTVQRSLLQRFSYVFAKNKYPGAPSVQLQTIDPAQIITIGGLRIQPIRVQHGSLPIVGFRIGKFAYLTDVKEVPAGEMEKLNDLDILVTSALHHYEHHSHMNFAEATEFARRVAARQTYFIHLSHHAGVHRELEATLPEGMHLGYDQLVFDV